MVVGLDESVEAARDLRHAQRVARRDEPADGTPIRLHPAGFEELYRTEYGPMVRVAYLITRSAARAEEIVNDGFITLLERWHTLDSPGGYLRTVVIRAAVRSKRRDGREAELAALGVVGTGPAEPGIDEMWDALGTLPVRQRAALVLRYYGDCSHEQVAAALHVPVATARSLVHRGILALRKDMDRWL